MSDGFKSHLKLRLDGQALVSNWRALAEISGSAACGAAVKADAYGLGAIDVVTRLLEAGCRDFYVATWAEACELEELTGDAALTVLNGVLAEDMPYATQSRAKPMLNSLEQVKRWEETGLPCDVMVDTGINRLGLELSAIAGIDWSKIDIDVLASHLASADEDSSQNAQQLAAFRSVVDRIPHRRTSLANSAGIALGPDYHFDLTRPGLSLYGGIPRHELADDIRSAGVIEAQILQVRSLSQGQRVGYNATFEADRSMTIAIISIGYADGYLRGFSSDGRFFAGDRELPVLGRVSMDLVALDISVDAALSEGDWVELPLDLPTLSAQSGLSQYELITGLGARFDRHWTDTGRTDNAVPNRAF